MLSMEAFIWAVFTLVCLRIIVGLWRLAEDEYPRTVKFEAVEDVISLVARIGLAIWAGILLFG